MLGARNSEGLRTVGDPQAGPTPPPDRPLTKRELDVLRFLPTRLSTTDIADNLSISPNTVKTHLKNIYQKLNARTRNEAIVHAAQRHLLSEESVALVTH